MKSLLLCGLCALLTACCGYPRNTGLKEVQPDDQQAASSSQTSGKNDDYDDSDMYLEPESAATHAQHQAGASAQALETQNSFYPSFAPFQPPLGHSRPFYQPEGAYSHRPTAYQQHVGFDAASRFSGYKGDVGFGASESHGLLGSGNFGVIRGGTFYNDNDQEQSQYDQFSNYYRNGHGRPSFFFGNPRPRQQQQFENFRDFADINVPSNPAYSQYVIVYANKNSTNNNNNKPKNIMEHLALLDQEVEVPTKKLSKSKSKLAKTYLGKKKPTKTSSATKDLYEPLLALS